VECRASYQRPLKLSLN